MGLRRILWASISVAALFIVFQITVMAHMAGGIGNLMKPTELFIGLWVVSPIAFLIWRLNNSLFWLVALLPIIVIGTFEFDNMGYRSNSSTAAIGLFYLPLYAWILIGLVGVGKTVLGR